MVKVKDMLYANAGNEAVCAAGECGGAVTALLTYALESKAVDAVVAMTKGADLYDGVPTIFTDPKEVIKSAGSLHCAPVAIGKFVAQYMNGARDKRIALPVKPCDARAILVMARRGKINKDNLLMIGVNCGGTVFPMNGREMIEKYYGVSPDDVIKEEIAKASSSSRPGTTSIRSTRSMSSRSTAPAAPELPALRRQDPHHGGPGVRQLGRHRPAGRQGHVHRGMQREGRKARRRSRRGEGRNGPARRPKGHRGES